MAMFCGGGSWLRLRLWFMFRASSYTFFSSIRDLWFVLKVVVRSVWQCASSVCPCDALKKGGRDEANAWCAEIKSSSRGMSYQMMQSCQHRQHTSDGEIACRKIGSGSFREIYLGKCQDKASSVAVKLSYTEQLPY
ncbi:hypothetical protein VNO80_16730 [Phaseolus coccineus]|uniref:Protein kinase domain-containing protein n=1 Tax=Phaseolus coccineus TaxID=3886 RepID=A0AAN9MRQ7_PHACN